MEKDTDSMNTVQMKPEYAASEVYSTVSEAPPVSNYNVICVNTHPGLNCN